MARIIVPLERNQDGHPPFATERVWAEKVEGSLYRIENIPFYARRLSWGDLVSTEEVDGALYLKSVVETSDNSTVRVVFFDRGRIGAFEDGLTSIGCDFEWFGREGLLAINVPSAAHHRSLMELIERCGGRDCIDYEEAALRFPEADQV